MAAGSLVTMSIMHRLAMKFCTVFRRVLSTRRHRPVVALAIVEMMIDVPVEVFRTVIPRSRADENTAGEPFGSVVPVRGAIIGRYFVISVGANRRLADTHRNLRLRVITIRQHDANANCKNTKVS